VRLVFAGGGGGGGGGGGRPRSLKKVIHVLSPSTMSNKCSNRPRRRRYWSKVTAAPETMN